jgi:hypothetical protein
MSANLGDLINLHAVQERVRCYGFGLILADIRSGCFSV